MRGKTCHAFSVLLNHCRQKLLMFSALPTFRMCKRAHDWPTWVR